MNEKEIWLFNTEGKPTMEMANKGCPLSEDAFVFARKTIEESIDKTMPLKEIEELRKRLNFEPSVYFDTVQLRTGWRVA